MDRVSDLRKPGVGLSDPSKIEHDRAIHFSADLKGRHHGSPLSRHPDRSDSSSGGLVVCCLGRDIALRRRVARAILRCALDVHARFFRRVHDLAQRTSSDTRHGPTRGVVPLHGP